MRAGLLMAAIVVGLCGPLAPASAHISETCGLYALLAGQASETLEMHNNAIAQAAEEENLAALFEGFPQYMGAVNEMAAAVADFMECLRRDHE